MSLRNYIDKKGEERMKGELVAIQEMTQTNLM